MSLPTYEATRYVVPLREGGSLPAVVETDAGEPFVVKFRGAGQGARVLVAEIVAGELGRRFGLPVPEVALIDLAEGFGRTERDPEIQDLLKASVGLNVGLRFLDGALGYDGLAGQAFVAPALAADLVVFDAFVFNLDRTPRNPNLLVARPPDAPAEPARLWAIDHGAAFYFHHHWAAVDETRARAPFPQSKDHVLLPLAGDLRAAAGRLQAALSGGALDDALALVPDALLLDVPPGHTPDFPTADGFRDAYRRVLAPRLADPAPFVDEAVRAQAALAEADARPLSYRR